MLPKKVAPIISLRSAYEINEGHERTVWQEEVRGRRKSGRRKAKSNQIWNWEIMLTKPGM